MIRAASVAAFALAGLALSVLSSVASAQPVEPVVPGVMPATEQSDQAALGVVPASSASERRLTPQQVDKVLSDAAKRNKEIPVRTATIADEAPPCPTRPHGEMGVGVGTAGYSSIYGTTVIPVGCRGAVAISIEQSNFGGGRYRRR